MDLKPFGACTARTAVCRVLFPIGQCDGAGGGGRERELDDGGLFPGGLLPDY